MTQNYQERVAKRPGYAKFKNRKKTIRRRRDAGKITPAEAAQLTREARDQYFAEYDRNQQREAIQVGAEWCTENPDHDAAREVSAGSCDHLCLGARGKQCHCRCEGRNHGLANGPQARAVQASKKTRTWVDDALLAPRNLATRWCTTGKITAAERMAVLDAVEAEITRSGKPLRDHSRWMKTWLNDEQGKW